MDGGTAVGIILVVIVLPFLFGALKESGRIKPPSFGRRRPSSRQFPAFPGSEAE